MDFQGDSGGGFQNSSQGGGGGGGGSQQKFTRRSYDEQTLIPVTVHMAMTTSNDPSNEGNLLLEDGRKIATVKLVGAVRNVSDFSTNVVYELEDGTGLLEVKQWLDDNDCSAMADLRQRTLQEAIYLKVVGQIKDYEGKKMLVANSVMPISSGNEIAHHMLQVVYSAEKHKRADSIVAPMAMNSGVGFGAPVSRSMVGGSSGGDDLKSKVIYVMKQQGGRW
jgi:replication factor A2